MLHDTPHVVYLWQALERNLKNPKRGFIIAHVETCLKLNVFIICSFSLLQPETMSEIVDQTRNDPVFDSLFNMFNVGEYLRI